MVEFFTFPIDPQPQDALPYTRDLSIAPYMTGAPQHGYSYYARRDDGVWESSKRLRRPPWALAAGPDPNGVWCWLAASAPIPIGTAALAIHPDEGGHQSRMTLGGIPVARLFARRGREIGLELHNGDLPDDLPSRVEDAARARRVILAALNRRWTYPPGVVLPDTPADLTQRRFCVVGHAIYWRSDGGDGETRRETDMHETIFGAIDESPDERIARALDLLGLGDVNIERFIGAVVDLDETGPVQKWQKLEG